MIKVLRDSVAVEKEKETEKKSAGGLVLIDLGDNNKHVTGVVVAVGSGYVSNGVIVPLEVAVGDKVTFNRTVAGEVNDGDTTYWVLREENILAVVS